MRHRFALAFLAVAVPAFAEVPYPANPSMTGEAFEAYVTGKTLTYAQDGTVYGTEQYKAGRKVVWAFTEDECREGYWYDKAPYICFVYEDPNDPQCWLFFMESHGMKAMFVGEGGGADLSEVAQSAGPMGCMGPQVGV
ncbi:MAG: hypothetical protein U1A24_14155 [Cypionkella sp.]|uniref:hypothetical protein n=1 Tax=Cypionkella sp. TaxID=2811411 RepID=UPI002AB87775|nr:hypothetical protein [Cypionkella sp.]MDZ4311684.1 hypothetical protein [Cypionkella sp.]MDZ4392149.1 hypothetical protein [Cypionkella sp.]